MTTYKENYSLLSAFISYYRRHYGIEHFLLLCGLSGSRTHTSLKQLISTRLKVVATENDQTQLTRCGRKLIISRLDGERIVLWAVTYPTTDFTSQEEFHALRMELHQWADEFLPPHITRTIVADNDEFLYTENPLILERIDRLGFHFVEAVPSPVWPPEALSFSLQGWYYRRQAQPRFRYAGRLAWAIAKKVGRGLEHGSCKTFYFDRAHLRDWTAWHHGTAGSLCSCFAADRHLNEPDRCGEILRSTACVYHLAMTCKDHFVSERLRLYSRLQTDLKKKPEREHDEGHSPETENQELALRTFDRFIKKSIFPTFRDDLLLPYLRVD